MKTLLLVAGAFFASVAFPAKVAAPFPADFKSEDFCQRSMMRFEFSTDSGKPSGPFRTIKYKHGVKVALTDCRVTRRLVCFRLDFALETRARLCDTICP